jgi:hypothetical protein
MQQRKPSTRRPGKPVGRPHNNNKRGQQIAAIPNNTGSILAAIVWKPTYYYNNMTTATNKQPEVDATMNPPEDTRGGN